VIMLLAVCPPSYSASVRFVIASLVTTDQLSIVIDIVSSAGYDQQHTSVDDNTVGLL